MNKIINFQSNNEVNFGFQINDDNVEHDEADDTVNLHENNETSDFQNIDQNEMYTYLINSNEVESPFNE